MKRLYRYLVPFAGDYSGVCSAIFELGGMICIHDAAGCTGNYTGFDEPRYYGSDHLVFCTGFRKTDAILGNEEIYLQKIENAAKELKPKFIAIVGSPVPLVIGFDFQGFSKELETRLNIPVFGFATNGMQGNYKTGIVMALEKVLDRYKNEIVKQRSDYDTNRKVNIIGATPLDISQDNLKALRDILEEHGYSIQSCFSMGTDLEHMLSFKDADVNLAISQAGLMIAKKIQNEYGIPYFAGIPVGKNGSESYFQILEQVIRTRISKSVWDHVESNENHAEKCALVLGDVVVAQSIKVQLLAEGYQRVDVCGLFGSDSGIQEVNCIFAESEDDMIAAVNQPDYDLIVADPFILELRKEPKAIELLEIPQYAISSKVAKDKDWIYIGENWSRKKR